MNYISNLIIASPQSPITPKHKLPSNPPAYTTMTQSSSEEKWNSPGNAYVLNADTPKMKRPDMEFIWRLECEIAKEEIEIGAPHGTGVVRSVANILDGKMSGPGIEGVVLPGGADWATCIEGTHVSFFSVLGVGGFESWGGGGGGGRQRTPRFVL